MPRPTKTWRRFEQLVAHIERTLAPAGAVVTSPDKLPSKYGRRRREVDASIRYQVGSVPILITVECRRRGAAQDQTWIEQLIQKKENVNAAKTIAVSSRPFTPAALEMAREHGIEARTIDSITFEDIRSWCSMETMTSIALRSELTGALLVFDRSLPLPDDLAFTGVNSLAELPVLPVIEIGGRRFRLIDLVDQSFGGNDEVQRIREASPIDGQRTNHSHRITFDGVSARVETNHGWMTLAWADCTLQFWREATESRGVPVQYSEGAQPILQVVSFPIPLGDHQMALMINRNPANGDMSLTLGPHLAD